MLAPIKGSSDVLFDHPMPSIQAAAAIALGTLSALTADQRYDNDAKTLLAAAPDRVGADAGTAIGTLGLALELRAERPARLLRSAHLRRSECSPSSDRADRRT